MELLISDMLNTASQIQRYAVALPTLVILAFLARFVLWAALSMLVGKSANTLTNIISMCAAAVLFTKVQADPAFLNHAVNWAYALASNMGMRYQFDTSFLGEIRQFDDVFRELSF